MKMQVVKVLQLPPCLCVAPKFCNRTAAALSLKHLVHPFVLGSTTSCALPFPCSLELVYLSVLKPFLLVAVLKLPSLPTINSSTELYPYGTFSELGSLVRTNFFVHCSKLEEDNLEILHCAKSGGTSCTKTLPPPSLLVGFVPWQSRAIAHFTEVHCRIVFFERKELFKGSLSGHRRSTTASGCKSLLRISN